jgi:hypothetical protein
MLSVLDQKLRDEIFGLFPLLRLGGLYGYGPTIRPTETVQQALRSSGLNAAA